jgi:predicted DNA-binding transcriptional regulator AlpA
MMAAPLPASPEFIPRSALRYRYGVSGVTLWRWENDAEINFPKPLIINNRKFYRRTDLEAWENSRGGK